MPIRVQLVVCIKLGIHMPGLQHWPSFGCEVGHMLCNQGRAVATSITFGCEDEA